MRFKPGYRTSEFWFTLVSFVFSALFLTGIIQDNGTKEELISVVTHAVESIILVGGQIIIFYRYVASRDRQKREFNYDNEKAIESHVGVGKTYDIININNADIGDLIQLPHIGTAIAQRIIDYRSTYGGFKQIEDIKNIKGVGDSIYQEIKNFISIQG